ncbi:NlpC/P60 family protein [Rickettsia endosymbiont of Cardiosporidium cionae]|uniref:NlpC/P60 family protein n=1 Tax=Rickettsia endosymbiont of Cardiosporidium cionae TaxID=2777155 RepID=UPI0018948259|nr:NlpC/P60 family protein [Rickettsia endosymbiont of Cardiosporidium cionae]KAF8818089.1 hypothetical protein IHI24_000888 [Rickettsia endosymbiont of Cardiosporidium cionae]
MKININKYIGKAWKNGASGPDMFDCWGFLRYIYITYYMIQLQPINVNACNTKSVIDAFSSHCEFNNWIEVPLAAAKEGDAILLGRNKKPSHVGIWIDPGAVLHCMRYHGVVFQKISNLSISSWNIIAIYKYVKNNNIQKSIS